MRRFRKGMAVVSVMCMAAVVVGAWGRPVLAQNGGTRYFPETRHNVSGRFLEYWQTHGGLAQQGYPISEEFAETSDLDGKQYTVQYFERAVFEKHPEKEPPFDVLLSQLGTFQYKAKYGEAGAPNQRANTQNGQQFKETGHVAGGVFLSYWQTHGGLAQQGYPISDEFTEVSELDGKPYTVQYFERAVFEMHPEKQSPFDVLLSQLGTFQSKKKYPGGAPGGEGQPQPTSAPVATSVPIAPTASVARPQPTGTTTKTNCEPLTDPNRKSSVSSTGPIEIRSVQYKGEESVTLGNKGGATVDVSRWTLRDKNEPGQRFSFPNGTQLPPGGTVQVYTKPGHPYTFNSGSSIWNDCGDALELLDSGGGVVATYAYGTHLLP